MLGEIKYILKLNFTCFVFPFFNVVSSKLRSTYVTLLFLLDRAAVHNVRSLEVFFKRRLDLGFRMLTLAASREWRQLDYCNNGW